MQRNIDNMEGSQSSSNSAPSRRQNWECPVCFQNYSKQNPRYKVCQGKHYICMNCILQLHTKQCPLCKRWFKIQKKQNNKLKILKGQREQQSEREDMNRISIRALLLLIYARRHGQLPQELLDALFGNQDQDNQERISNISRQNQGQVRRQQIQIDVQGSINQSRSSQSLSILSQHPVHLNEQFLQHSRRLQLRAQQLSLHHSSSVISQQHQHLRRQFSQHPRRRERRTSQTILHQSNSQESSVLQINENQPMNENRRRQISIGIQQIQQQKSCDCNLFTAIGQGFQKIINFFRNSNTNQNVIQLQ